MWRVAANILDKQSRAADRSFPSSFGRRINNSQFSVLLFSSLVTVTEGFALSRFLVRTEATESGHEILNVECY
jgi:hypothetical protein